MALRMLKSVSKHNYILRNLCYKNIISPKIEEINCTRQIYKTVQRTSTILNSSLFNNNNKIQKNSIIDSTNSLYNYKSDSFRLSGKDDDSDVSSSSSGASFSGSDEDGGGDKHDDDIPHPELGPQMTALSPINVPDVWPSVPVIAIKRTPLFPK